jgi:hypothetical protein
MRYAESAFGPGRSGDGSGRLAQRESASFTPRRSLVRSQYRPPGQRSKSKLIKIPVSSSGSASTIRSEQVQTVRMTAAYSAVSVMASPCLCPGALARTSYPASPKMSWFTRAARQISRMKAAEPTAAGATAQTHHQAMTLPVALTARIPARTVTTPVQKKASTAWTPTCCPCSGSQSIERMPAATASTGKTAPPVRDGAAVVSQ